MNIPNLFACFLLIAWPLAQQVNARPNDLSQTTDSLNHKRLKAVLIGGSIAYGAASVTLYHAWYKNYDLGPFHTYNDSGEWLGMDKAGHFYATYAESELAARLASWTGFSPQKAAWLGAGTGMLIQTTLEVMDGFSEKWGFSWTDMAFNAAGAALFLAQELSWKDQKIRLKGSARRSTYPEGTVFSLDRQSQTTLKARGQALFGQGPVHNFLKNYNATTTWLSINPASFTSRSAPSAKIFPVWLNIAIGFGAENLYGGYHNTWTGTDGAVFELSEDLYPRYHQYFLSIDIDLSKIPTKSKVLKTLFTSLNWLKIPAPTLEWNTLGKFKGYVLY